MDTLKFGRGFYENGELPTERAVREAEEVRWVDGICLRPLGNNRFAVIPASEATDDCETLDIADNA